MSTDITDNQPSIGRNDMLVLFHPFYMACTDVDSLISLRAKVFKLQAMNSTAACALLRRYRQHRMYSTSNHGRAGVCPFGGRARRVGIPAPMIPSRRPKCTSRSPLARNEELYSDHMRHSGKILGERRCFDRHLARSANNYSMSELLGLPDMRNHCRPIPPGSSPYADPFYSHLRVLPDHVYILFQRA